MVLLWWTTRSEVHYVLRYPYKNLESAVSRTNFSALLLPQFNEMQIFVFPWSYTRKDLSIDVSITNVALILTKLS